MPGYPSDNPMGVGAASFLNSLAGGLQQNWKQQDANKGKEALQSYIESIKQPDREKLVGERGDESRETKKTIPGVNPNSARGGRMSPSDTHFISSFEKMAKSYTAIADKYNHPNMMNDINFYNTVKDMTPEQKETLINQEFIKDYGQNNLDLLQKPENQNHYKTLIGQRDSYSGPAIPSAQPNPISPKAPSIPTIPNQQPQQDQPIYQMPSSAPMMAPSNNPAGLPPAEGLPNGAQ